MSDQFTKARDAAATALGIGVIGAQTIADQSRRIATTLSTRIEPIAQRIRAEAKNRVEQPAREFIVSGTAQAQALLGRNSAKSNNPQARGSAG